MVATEREANTEAKPEPPDEPAGVELYFVMIMHVSRWTVFVKDNGEQAVATTLERAEAMLADAKKFIDRHSNKETGKRAATGLRIARSDAELL